MADMRNIHWIGESALRKNYEALYRFYQRIWKEPHDFIVMNARRCFNLNYIFLKVYEAEGGIAANTCRIISNNALLLYAKKFADSYARTRRFPSTLIVDDLVLHGRGLANLLSEFEELIVSELPGPPEEMSRDERYYIRRDLASAVDICAFAANRQPLLLEDIYLQKFWCSQRLYTKEIRLLSQQISSFLQRADVPNTSYVLSCQLQGPPVPSGKWTRQSWSYRGIRQEMYFRCRSRTEEIRLLPTIRYRVDPGQEAGSPIWLTSLTLFGELTMSDLSEICGRMRAGLDQDAFPRLYHILQQEHPLLQKQRAQLISFILSADRLKHFLVDAVPGYVFVDRDTDIEKVAQNFGKTADILTELQKLVNGPVLNALDAVLWDMLRSLAAPLFHEPMVERDAADVMGIYERLSREAVNARVEDIFYDLGMSSERSAYRILTSSRYPADRCAPGEISLEDLLLWPDPDMGFWYPRYLRFAPPIRKLSSMLAMMDNGLMAMHIGYRKGRDGGTVQCFLKAGELATFSIPRRLYLFIPALALVERDCWRVNMDPPSAVKRFIDTLPDADMAALEADGEKEQRALLFLKTHGHDLVDLLYDCGQTFNGWDIDLVTSDDWMEESRDTDYLSFIFRGSEDQESYLERARDFLSRA